MFLPGNIGVDAGEFTIGNVHNRSKILFMASNKIILIF